MNTDANPNLMSDIPNVDWYKAQLREAVRLLMNCPRGSMLIEIRAFLAKHADIVKELNG